MFLNVTTATSFLARFPAKKQVGAQMHRAIYNKLLPRTGWHLIPFPPPQRVYGRTLRHNQIFSDGWFTKFYYPWCSAGALRAPELRYYYLILEKRTHFVYMLVNKEISVSQKGLFIEGDLLKSHAYFIITSYCRPNLEEFLQCVKNDVSCAAKLLDYWTVNREDLGRGWVVFVVSTKWRNISFVSRGRNRRTIG